MVGSRFRGAGCEPLTTSRTKRYAPRLYMLHDGRDNTTAAWTWTPCIIHRLIFARPRKYSSKKRLIHRSVQALHRCEEVKLKISGIYCVIRHHHHHEKIPIHPPPPVSKARHVSRRRKPCALTRSCAMSCFGSPSSLSTRRGAHSPASVSLTIR